MTVKLPPPPPPPATTTDDLDDEDDPFINEYIAKRMKEMLDRYQRSTANKQFGELKHLPSGEAFLKHIDDVQLRSVLIVTHIYNHKIVECNMMNNCIDKLARKYPDVLFCSLDAINVGMSREFVSCFFKSNIIHLLIMIFDSSQTKYGVPALLIYKNGELIGNFVSLGDEFGADFDEKDVEDFLVE